MQFGVSLLPRRAAGGAAGSRANWAACSKSSPASITAATSMRPRPPTGSASAARAARSEFSAISACTRAISLCASAGNRSASSPSFRKAIPQRPDGKGGMAACDTWDNAMLHCMDRHRRPGRPHAPGNEAPRPRGDEHLVHRSARHRGRRALLHQGAENALALRRRQGTVLGARPISASACRSRPSPAASSSPVSRM